MINEQIRDKEVRLIGPDGAQLGIVSSREAFAKAQEAGLDLVKIAPQANRRFVKLSTTASIVMSSPVRKKKLRKNRRQLTSRKYVFLQTLIPMT